MWLKITQLHLKINGLLDHFSTHWVTEKLKFRLQGITIIKSCVGFLRNFRNHLLKLFKIKEIIFTFLQFLAWWKMCCIISFCKVSSNKFNFLWNPSIWPTRWDTFRPLPCHLKFRTLKWDVKIARYSRECMNSMSCSSLWNSCPRFSVTFSDFYCH
jgi:hypothetical protein